MIRGYFLNGLSDTAVQMFDEMPERDLVSYNTVIAGLMRCGHVGGARRAFEGMGIRDVVTWNSMVSGYVRNGMINEGIKMFDKMPAKDVVSWNLVIGGLVRNGDIDLAGDYFRRMSCRDIASWTIMITGLSSFRRVSEARQLFDEMPERDNQAWNAMILGYVENGAIQIAEALFHKMPYRDFDSLTTLVNGFARFGRFKDALRLYAEMPEQCQKTRNSILLECIRNKLVRETHAFLEKTPNKDDVVSWTNLIVGYFAITDVDSALRLFNFMTVRDTTVYNVTVFGLGENDRGEEGIEIFTSMMRESRFSPDESTITSVLTICSNMPAGQLGRQTHSLSVKSGFSGFVAVCNATITMYAKCGDSSSALLVFSSMTSREIISWNSIICGLAYHGKAEKALEIFEEMRSKASLVEPNHITFVGVLSACSHAGLVERGRHFFSVMRFEFSLRPTSEHYTCLVDLLGRFGLIHEAVSLLGEMREDGIGVPASVWGALLGACRIHKNVEVAEIVGERVLEIEPWNSGVYLILSEMYVTCGRRKDAEAVWARMKSSGVKKQPGCSWVELNSGSRVFLSGDRFNSELSEVSFLLELLHMDMKSKHSEYLDFCLQQVEIS